MVTLMIKVKIYIHYYVLFVLFIKRKTSPSNNEEKIGINILLLFINNINNNKYIIPK